MPRVLELTVPELYYCEPRANKWLQLDLPVVLRLRVPTPHSSSLLGSASEDRDPYLGTQRPSLLLTASFRASFQAP